ncbi:unnamed protein product [Microthlaspi erraticum]|uniref:FYR C-terminal domain-containing protein n=1 Tax=Microthlaspi erraticum TaxID=1685480 RepID=A0A6D2HTE3_9BRAS|nr:unnamed protein product [Microthlaspi erraticum]
MAIPLAVSMDDLQIVSVGALYSGSWEKKYWSSSRGKDRFPYPVGYKAVRAHNEKTYYIEIEEGAIGPLFLIRYLAESWTGPTPEIAWGKFHKTFLSHLKACHGKRFTCKMSGVEFFGFKQRVVQRLLRQLVYSMVKSSSSDKVSQKPINEERPVMREIPNVSCYLDKPVARNKRSKKPEILHQDWKVKDGHKKPRLQNSAKGQVELVGLEGAPTEQMHSTHATDENSNLPQEKAAVSIQETDRLPDGCKSMPLSKFSKEENKPNDDDILLHESQDMNGYDLCVPDTQFLQDSTIRCAPKMDDNTSSEQKEELNLADVEVNEWHVADSAESNAENLTDSADEETVTSMISFLLPQAIPLLKKASSNKSKKNDICKTSQLDDASGAAESLSITSSGDSVEDFTSNVPIAPDSFDEQVAIVNANLSENKEAKSECCSTKGNGFVVGTSPTEVGSIRKEKHKVYSRKRVSTSQQLRNRNSSSESKQSCRNTGDNDCISKMSPIKIPRILELQPTLPTKSVSDSTNPLEDESGHVTEQCQGPELMKVNNNNHSTDVSSNEMCVVQPDMRTAHDFGNASISPSSFPASKVEEFQADTGEALGIQVSAPPSTKSQYKDNTSEKTISSVPEFPASSNLKLSRDIKINDKMEKTVELLGCYFHPMPVSSVSLQSAANDIYICVLSFATEDRVRTLFMYKISAKSPTKGFPSIVGHTPAIFPIVDDKSGGNVNPRTLERSYLHFTPDGQHLIFTGNIKTPYCRKREIDCSCLTCASACFEENAVRIVQVKTGHVTLVTKLQAVDSVQCAVVCDPNYLVAVVKSGNLIVWAMNSQWRDPTEEFVILVNPCISPCIVELKKVPKCPHLVIGRNDIGELTLWDISKRCLVSRFVCPSNLIFEFIPTSLFAWHPVHSHSTIEDQMDMILAATKLWFSKGVNNKTLVPAEVKDTAIWLLVSTDLDADAKSNPESPATCWRLALLVRNQVIFGTQLDPRADVAGTVSGYGVAGTLDGLVYLWDLATGVKLGSLYDFKGKEVSCISSDDSGNICIASEDGQLLVYSHPAKETQDQQG